jgi:ParB-like chromosome segregation protein Spo0J
MEIKILKQIEVVSLDTIHLYPENPREMEASQFERLKKSIIEYGFIDPLIVNKRTHESFTADEKKPTIMGGNMRYRAAKELGLTEVPIAWIDVDKNKEKILNIALNRITGKWDIGKLEKMIFDLSNDDLKLDLDLTGLEDWELKLYNPAEDVDAEDIEKIIGTDEKPTYVLKIVFGDEAEFEKASRILGGDKRIRNIIRGEKLLEVLDAYEKSNQS